MVLAEAASPNHILHLLLSIVTLGVWLLVWLILAAQPKTFRCTSCGAVTRQPTPTEFKAMQTSGAASQIDMSRWSKRDRDRYVGP